MKKLMFLTALLAMGISYSCSNDFELIEDWSDIPVVFGLLSRADTAHYVRVEKAFVDPTTSALTIAQIPDSLYYSSLDVKIEHISSGKIFQLERVDGNLEGYPREEGIFANTPNFLYKFKLSNNEELIAGDAYELKINRGENLALITARTNIVGDMEIASPATRVKFEAERTTNFRWSARPNTRFFDLALRLNYLENSVDAPNTFTEKVINWPLAKNIDREESDNFAEFDLPDGNEFFRFIALALKDTGNLTRDFKTINVVVTAGDQNLDDYINIGQANTGITSAQEIPTFTNLSEGLGVFGSTNTSVGPGIGLDAETEDSLRFGFITKDLNFQ